jgi:hypothetical protein
MLENRPLKEVHGLRCVEPNCQGGELELKWSGKLNRWFYGCGTWPACLGTMPANPDGSPKGEPRTRELQGWRRKAHEVFDKIWKEGHLARGQAYAWLHRQLGWEEAPHMQNMNIEQCQQVIAIVQERGPDSPSWVPQ